jgi:conjugal transfer pilus assembly protein TraB
MMSRFISATTKVKIQQNLLFYIALVILSGVIVVLLVMLVGGSPSQENKPQSYKVNVATGASRVDSKEMWAEKFSNEYDKQRVLLENQENQIKELSKVVNSLMTIVAGKSQPQQIQPSLTTPTSPQLPNQGQTPTPEEALKDLHQEVSAQAKALQDGEDIIKSGSANTQTTHDPARFSSTPVQASQPFRSKGINRTVIALVNAKNGKALKTHDNTIPAGAFAKAVMVGGVDASTSIQASQDPRPVLLRIADAGTLPRKFKSDLKGCHVLAACYGDISSERVYMRLEKLTCTERQTGEVVEMQVNGYVAGEDGRAGLRGVVVDRAGVVVRNAAIGGFLAGMGNFLSQSHSQSPITFAAQSGLAQTNPLQTPEMLKQGAAKGASGALEKYADFYIKRAEQMQPVIQVQAGRIVDVVFTQGTAFENSASRETLVRVNDQQRLSQLQPSQQEKPIEAWIPQQNRE